MAYADTGAIEDAHQLPPVSLMEIPQLTNPGEVRDEPLLPPFLYIPSPVEQVPRPVPAQRSDGESTNIVGAFAHKRGIEVPGRLVSSAKPWLSHAGVARPPAILPVNAPAGVEKLSPIQVSREYLAHMRNAWDSKFPDSPFAEPQALVT